MSKSNPSTDGLKSNKLIAIVGPTASGKTGIGVTVAKEFNGEIISADSRQVFHGLNLGTGKEGEPKAIINNQKNIGQAHDLPAITKQSNENCKLKIENLRNALRFVDGVPQWLIDIKDPGEEFHLFEFLELAKLAIEDIQSRGKVPVIVGGTGLYIQGLVEGFALREKGKNQGTTIKQYNREQLERMGKEGLWRVLEEIDPKAFEIVDENNPHRLIRAIERAQEGTEMIKIKPDYEVLQIGINWPRETLYERIDKRVDDRFDQGMLEEVVGLLKRRVDLEWLMKLGLEYRVITQFLISNSLIDPVCPTGGLNKFEIEQIKKSQEFKVMAQVLKYKIHQFAKRQCTWFNRFPEIVWDNDHEKIKKIINSFLSN